jgi:hypothetical protein
VVIYGDFEAVIEHGPVVGVDLALAFMPKLSGRGKGFVGVTQVGLFCAAELAEMVRLGGRLDAALLEDGRAQSALVPFVHLEIEGGTILQLELTANLDEPFGFAFEEGGIWGASLLAGSRF